MRSLVPLAVLLSASASLVAACSSSISKRPARPGRPAPAAPPPASTPAPTAQTNISFPTFKCPHPYSEYYCLNDAKCFAIVIQDSPLYNCECKDGFVGQRCEYKDLENSYVLTSRRLMMETASIAGGASVAAFLAVLVCAGAWLRLRRRGKAASGGAVQLLAVASGARAQHVARKAPAPAAPPSAGDRPTAPPYVPLPSPLPSAGDHNP